jgi:hypothetical protein
VREDTVYGAIRGKGEPELMKLPLDGRGAHLSERLLFQSLSRTHNQRSFFRGGLSGMSFRLPAVFLVPFQVARLISLQPLEKPPLRAIHPGIDFLRRLFFFHVLHDRELPDLFFHAITSSMVVATIIARKRA